MAESYTQSKNIARVKKNCSPWLAEYCRNAGKKLYLVYMARRAKIFQIMSALGGANTLFQRPTILSELTACLT